MASATDASKERSTDGDQGGRGPVAGCGPGRDSCQPPVNTIVKPANINTGPITSVTHSSGPCGEPALRLPAAPAPTGSTCDCAGDEIHHVAVAGMFE